MTSGPKNGARKSTGRPESTATRPNRAASPSSASAVPASGIAAPGSSTISDSVPSKSTNSPACGWLDHERPQHGR